MAAKQRKETPQGSYTVREEQTTMLGLPTQAPVHYPEDWWIAKLAPEFRLQRVVTRYRGPAVSPNQMGLGAGLGVEPASNQLDLFGHRAPSLAGAPLPPSSAVRANESSRKEEALAKTR